MLWAIRTRDEKVFYAILGTLLIGFGIADFFRGKVFLSFGEYSASRRPMVFYIYVIFSITFGAVLLVHFVVQHT